MNKVKKAQKPALSEATETAKPKKVKKAVPAGAGSGESSISRAEGAKEKGKRKATDTPTDVKVPPKKKAKISLKKREIEVIDKVVTQYCDLGEMSYPAIVADVARSKLPMFAGGTLYTIKQSEEFKELEGMQRPDLVIGRIFDNKDLLGRVKGIYSDKGESLLGFTFVQEALAKAMSKPEFERHKDGVYEAISSSKPGLKKAAIAKLIEKKEFQKLGDLVFKA
ncbi:MAG: hypothetical protein S4CHLAM37_05770 [Chlamydiia bacterium]|nr:hypothetical protein [Chlamydiia bacterium]